MSNADEATLIRRCLAGDRDAWDDLFDRHYGPVFRFVFQFSGRFTHEDVEEICQEVFVAVVQKLGSFRGGCALQTWLFRVASNKARDFLEKRSAVKRGGGEVPLSLDVEHPDSGLKLDPPDSAHAPDVVLADSERLQAVHDAVERLEEPCREIVQLRYFGDLSYEELAGLLQLNPKTVSSRLSRCLDRLEGLVQSEFSRGNPDLFPV